MQTGTRFGADLAGSTSASRFGFGKSGFARIATIALLGLMMIAGFGIAAPDSALAGQAGMINTNGVEIFEHPTDLTVIGSVDAGDWVDIFWGPEYEMYEIRSGDGTIGWVWAEFLDVEGAGSTSSSSESSSSSSSSSADQAGAWSWSAWAMVDADSLNVRSDASSSASVWDQYGPGEWIEVIGNDVNGFSPINYHGDVGWVSTKYLSWDGSFNYATISSSSASSSSGSSGGGSSTSGQEHWIDVNASSGKVTLYVGDNVQAVYWGSVGYDRSADGFYSTAVGTYYVYAMHDPLAYTAWADAYITEWVGFDQSRFNGFHSYSKDGNGNILPNGGGKTGGCVALPPGDAQAVFDFSYMGMRVEVHQ